MADESHVIRGIDWKTTFPFTQIFRSFRIAIHPSKIILALLTMLLIWFGGWFLDRIWPARDSAVRGEVALYGQSYADAQPKDSFRVRRQQEWDDMRARHEAALRRAKGTSLGDIKNDIIKRREENAADARARFDKSDKSPRARTETNNAIRDAYRDAEIEWDEAIIDARGVGLFKTFYDYEVGLVNQTVPPCAAGTGSARAASSLRFARFLLSRPHGR